MLLLGITSSKRKTKSQLELIMYASLYLLEFLNNLSPQMTCHAYVLPRVGLDLMHLLGWVTIHDTQHHMGVLRKIL
jgi:hypothetical protein